MTAAKLIPTNLGPFVRTASILKFLKITEPTLAAMIAEGRFPHPIKLHSKARSLFPTDEVREAVEKLLNRADVA